MPAPIICPTITAYSLSEYRQQMQQITSFASRVHIDCMDGQFAPSVSPGFEHLWWPPEIEADLHVMYQSPMDFVAQIVALHPRMVIIHNEAHVHHMHFSAILHKEGIKTGLAVLQDTPIEYAFQIMHSFDEVLIFSGRLGSHGGIADLGLLHKAVKIREHHPTATIAWDGGINAENLPALVAGGIDVLNVGGYIQNNESPEKAYATLEALINS